MGTESQNTGDRPSFSDQELTLDPRALVERKFSLMSALAAGAKARRHDFAPELLAVLSSHRLVSVEADDRVIITPDGIRHVEAVAHAINTLTNEWLETDSEWWNAALSIVTSEAN